MSNRLYQNFKNNMLKLEEKEFLNHYFLLKKTDISKNELIYYLLSYYRNKKNNNLLKTILKETDFLTNIEAKELLIKNCSQENIEKEVIKNIIENVEESYLIKLYEEEKFNTNNSFKKNILMKIEKILINKKLEKLTKLHIA